MNQNTALLRLPTEIRQEIWKHALGGKTYEASCFSGRYYSESYKFAPSAAEPRNGMALLRTCRQIYSEAVLYPFFQATFACHDVTYLKRSVKLLHAYQRKHVAHLWIDCRWQYYGLYLADSGLLSDKKLDFKKLFPTLSHVTVFVHGIADAGLDSDGHTFVASTESIPPRLRDVIEATGASLDVKSTDDLLPSRHTDEMDDVNNDDEDNEDSEEDGPGDMAEVEAYQKGTLFVLDREQAQGQTSG